MRHCAGSSSRCEAREEIPISGSNGYWEWRDGVLKHPDGRATGGEPCVMCGEPVPPNAAWIHRDRHVCSKGCNRRLSRRFASEREWGELEGPSPYPDLIEDPRQDLTPRFFGPGQVYGYGPVDGDVVERYGVRTGYRWVKPGGSLPVHPDAPEGYLVSIHESGHFSAVIARRQGRSSRMLMGDFEPTGARMDGAAFTFDGVELVWTFEIVRHIEGEEECTWRARVCLPLEHRRHGTQWSAEYTARSEQRRRTSSSTARHARRVRVADATVERFDPVEVFERDGWICGLCGQPIDRSRAWPDPASVSLDHVLPLAAGGEHSRANTQAAHWICNVRKGPRTDG